MEEQDKTETGEQVNEERSHGHEHVDGMKDSILEPRCVGDVKAFRVSSLSSAKSRRFSMTIGLSSSVSSSRRKSRKE